MTIESNRTEAKEISVWTTYTVVVQHMPMPLCSNSTPRKEIACSEEHCTNQGDHVLGCSARPCLTLCPMNTDYGHQLLFLLLLITLPTLLFQHLMILVIWIH